MAGGTFIAAKKQVVIVGPVAATGTQAIALGLGDCYAIGLEITAASGTTETMDLVAQTSLDGTNWVDIPIKWAQKTTSTTAGIPDWMVFRCGLGQNEVALNQVTSDTGAAVIKNCIFDPNNFRVKYTIAGTNPSYTFKLNVFTLPVQRVA